MSDLAEVFNSAIEKSDKCGQCGTITACIGGDSEAHWCCNCGAKLRGNHPYPTIANIPPRIWDDEKKQYKYLKVPVTSEVPMPEPKPDRVTQIGHGPRIHSHSPQQFKKWGESCRAAGEAAGYARGLAEAGRDAERYRTVRFLATAERDPLPDYEGDTSSPDAFDASIDHATVALRGEVKL